MSDADPVFFAIKPVTLDTVALRKRLAARPREAATALRQAARAGSPAAQVVFGQLLLDGRGIDRDPVAALGWFERAAGTGFPEALNMVGRCHEKGWGVPQDYRRAMPWFERALALGHVWAKVNLAQLLMRLGDEGDRPRAFSLFEEAATAGNLKAVNSLARFYEEGWVVPRDPQRAMVLFRAAAEQGDHWAQFNLATLLYGVGSTTDAISWLDRAISRSDDGFRQRIAAVLLRQGDPALQSKGLAALEYCVLNGDAAALAALTEALDAKIGCSSERGRLAAICRDAAAGKRARSDGRTHSFIQRTMTLLRGDGAPRFIFKSFNYSR